MKVFMNKILLALVFVMGICLAMNEGAWFPISNIAGVMMIGIFGWMGKRFYHVSNVGANA